MKIRLRDWYDESCDACYSTTEAILYIHGVQIPLCDNCIKELKRELDGVDESEAGERIRSWIEQ